MPTIAVWQMSPESRAPAANLDRLRAIATRARDGGADLLVAPELSLTGYDVGELPADLVGDPVADIAEVAGSVGIALVVGAARWHDGTLRNSSVIADADGSIADVYDKAHLWGELDRTRFQAGDRTHGLGEVAGLRVATMICYDAEFPEAVRSAMLDGADLVAVPTANMAPLEFVNEVIIAARAIENGVFVAYANHHGREADTVYVGHSVIAAPDGSVVRASPDAEELLTLSINVDALARARGVVPYSTDRRPSLYRALLDHDSLDHDSEEK